MRHPNDLKFIRVKIYIAPQMIYSEKWCCCSGMHLHNCIFTLPILMCDFCLPTLLWFESTTWNSNHKRNWIEWTWKYHMSAYYKKWKEKYVWEVRKIDSCFYLYSSIWSPMIVFFRVSAVFISVSSFMKFLILNKLNNWV